MLKRPPCNRKGRKPCPGGGLFLTDVTSNFTSASDDGGGGAGVCSCALDAVVAVAMTAAKYIHPVTRRAGSRCMASLLTLASTVSDQFVEGKGQPRRCRDSGQRIRHSRRDRVCP